MAKVQLSHKDQIVMVLDDNELTRSTLKQMYEDRGATVYTSGNIEKAESVLKGLVNDGKIPNLIITDVRLPGCFGLMALRMIKDSLQGNHTPIIVTSRGFNQLAVRMMSLYGVIGYVVKPVLTCELYNFSNELLSDYLRVKAPIEQKLKAVS